MSYAIAPNGIFRTIQGEGQLLGTPMVFVRLAGCSIGCAGCDTNYRVDRRMSLDEVVAEVATLSAKLLHRWVWITGGEPTDHKDLWTLTERLKADAYKVALATAGQKQVPGTWERTGPSYLSVSPHDPSKWVQLVGNELKIVPGLNGFRLKDFGLDRPLHFGTKYVQPCDGMPETVEECRRFVEEHPGWLMTCQAHKLWRLP